jgi:AcrR family transcriptional regulator
MAAHSPSKTQTGDVKQRRRYAPRLPAAQRREQLIDAALGVILEQGYEGISMEAVARAAGVTRPVVYDHFQNLAQLLQALITREEQRSLEQLQAVVPDTGQSSDLSHLLAWRFRRFLEAVSERPATWRLTLLPPEGTPAIVRDHVASNRARILKQIEDNVRLSLGRSEPVRDLDVELTARAIRDLAEEAGRMVLTDPERYTPERYATFIESITNLLRPKPSRSGTPGRRKHDGDPLP